jgi:hypothetical protein
LKKRHTTYPLRLPTSVKAEVMRRAKADGTSVNQFVATAVAEKLAAMNTAAFFAERRDRADFAAFDKIMKRKCGQAQEPEDRMP